MTAILKVSKLMGFSCEEWACEDGRVFLIIGIGLALIANYHQFILMSTSSHLFDGNKEIFMRRGSR